ncbi:MAG: hypothetical protein GY801_02680 [bacterium]|nr:hypothetical protein [bacterium]
MNIIPKVVLICFLFFLSGCGAYTTLQKLPGNVDMFFEDVAIIRLIANPEQYHQKNVRIRGFAVIQFERLAVYRSKEFAEKGSSENAIWLDVKTIDRINSFEIYHNHYVLIEGIFDKNHHGHLSAYAGALKEIGRVESRK